jgi:hypothetical protein
MWAVRECWGMTFARVPRRGERVRVNDHEGTVGKLELWENPKQVLWDVPFGAIHLVRAPETEAA